MRNSVNQNIVQAKENYFKRAFSENNSKETWNIINDLTSKNRKSSHIHEVDLNGNLINDSNKIADAFNEHVSNIGPKLADNVDVNQNNRCYLNYLSSHNNNIRFQLKETNFSEVFVLLSKLSRSKATGLDKLLSHLFQECPDLIVESLSYILIDQLQGRI